MTTNTKTRRVRTEPIAELRVLTRGGDTWSRRAWRRTGWYVIQFVDAPAPKLHIHGMTGERRVFGELPEIPTRNLRRFVQ